MTFDNHTIQVIIFFAVGLFSIIGSVLDWNYFLEHRRARLIMRLLGRKGARIFYTLMGIGMLYLGYRMM